ncbi:hypothetical protein IJS77_00320 [bacterium]|nr:hypothetical protein [bacterium]
MKISGLNNHVNFGRIKLDGIVSWNLINKSSEKEINDIKNMSLKGFLYGHVYYSKDSKIFILKGEEPIDGKKQWCSYLGHYITADRVRNAIKSYNMSE